MPRLDRVGRFLAQPVDWGINQTKSGKPQLSMEFAILGAPGADGGWEDWSQHNFSITGFFVMLKNDGTANANTLQNLCDALGWDGKSFESLQHGDWATKKVQIETEMSEWDGKTMLKVKWINPENYVGGTVKKMDVGSVKSLDAQYGAILRATPLKAREIPF